MCKIPKTNIFKEKDFQLFRKAYGNEQVQDLNAEWKKKNWTKKK